MAQLQDILEGNVDGMGYECIDFELTPQGVLRVFIDRIDGNPVTLDDCVLVSNQLGRVLAVEDVDYNHLEVSSPGLDRVLKKEKDFLRFMGSEVKIRVVRRIDGQSHFQGRLKDFKEGVISLEQGESGGIVQIELANVRQARLKPEI